MKVISSMLSILLLGSIVMAQDTQTTDQTRRRSQTMTREDHVEMHQNMAKAHQQTAECLQQGKSIDECRAQFQAACDEAGAPGCGMMMGRGRGMQGRAPSAQDQSQPGERAPAAEKKSGSSSK